MVCGLNRVCVVFFASKGSVCQVDAAASQLQLSDRQPLTFPCSC